METIFAPQQVAERLGATASQTRRITRTYERVFGPLGRDSRGGRLYTSSALETIEAAHVTVAAGQYASLEAEPR